ncbi:MAG: hypothetical protein ACYC26_03050 [Phycisphaerales bacterium]
MGWNAYDIVEAVTSGLRRRAAALDQEQAVYGIDVLDELQLHPLIQQSLRDAGFGVWPEQPYPSDRPRKKMKQSAKRCDVVLTPDDRPLMDPDAETTLFEPRDAVVMEAAFWLEIKTVSQFTTEGPFARYSAELLSPVSQDIKKLAGDPLIFHAGLLLVLFTETRAVAEHDLAAWFERVLKRGYPVAQAVMNGFELNDRMGNGYVTVALFTVRRL